MKIQDVDGENVKIGKTSITVIDEYGKTKGVVRNLRKFRELPCSTQIDFISSIRKKGMTFNLDEVDNFFLADGEMWYLYNNNGDSFWQEHEPEVLERKQEVLNNVRQYMKVLSVSFCK